MSNHARSYLNGFSIAAFCTGMIAAAAPAQAQSADETAEAEDGNVIVVTGLKRGEQDLVSTPAAIVTIDGSRIEDIGADGLDDFLQFAPGASIDRNFGGGTTTIQVRGVNATFGSASVGFYLDDLPVSFVNLNFLPDPSPYDLARLEVLKGPQGALYGAGSSGGVVLVKTNDPVLDAFEGKADLSISSTRGGGTNYSASGALNIPIVEDVAALRGVISYQDNSGWIDDTLDPTATNLNSEERLNARVKLLVEPTPDLSIKLLGVYSDTTNDFGIDQADDNGQFPFSIAGFDSFTNNEYYQLGAVVAYDFPAFTVTNALGYINLELNQNRPFLVPIPTEGTLETTSNELRINSTDGGALSWVAGFYYRNSKQDLFQELAAVGLPADVNDQAESTQYSVFGELGYSFMDDALEVTLGGSYFWDDTSNFTDLTPILPQPTTNDVETRRFSPQASLAYHPTPDTTIYVRYAEGFRAATVDFGLPLFFAQTQVPGLTGRVTPEDIQSYELGAKGEFLGGRVYLEGAVFLNDISDIQQSAAVLVPGTTIPANTVLNAGEARTYGFEWLVSVEPADGLDLAFSGAYTNAQIRGDFFAPGADPATAAPLFADGTRLNLVPELMMNGSAIYNAQLNDSGLELTSNLSVQYSSDRPITVLASPSILSDDIVRVDFRLELGQDNWAVFAFADNLTDEDGAVAPTRDTATLINSPAAGLLSGIPATRLRPRTIGGGIRLSF